MPLSQERCQGPTLRDSGSPWCDLGVEKNLEGFEQVSAIFEAHKVENYPQNGPFWSSKMAHFEGSFQLYVPQKWPKLAQNLPDFFLLPNHTKDSQNPGG